MHNYPKITIVTVVRNDKDRILTTMDSVIKQTYNNLEYIVVDGASTDGTLDLIKSQKDNISHFISEKDGSVYEAMMKGVYLATGEWILFLNAGDVFLTNTLLEEVSYHMQDCDVIYGDCEIDYGDYILKKNAGDMSNLWKGMNCSHQSLFAKLSLLKQHPFELKYKIEADYNFLIEVSKKARILKIDKVISRVSSAGMADIARLSVHNNYRKIIRKHFGFLKSTYQYLYIGREVLRLFLKIIIPRKLFIKLKQLRHQKIVIHN